MAFPVKVVIVLLADHAEKNVAFTLAEILIEYDPHIIQVDDVSKDTTVEKA
jgi:hypothetical protein